MRDFVELVKKDIVTRSYAAAIPLAVLIFAVCYALGHLVALIAFSWTR
mgnify:CR=1 FL=1